MNILLDFLIVSFLIVILLGFKPLFEIFKNFKKDKKASPTPSKIKKPDSVYKIIAPIISKTSLEEMRMFYSAVSSIGRDNSSHQFTFEFHSDQGKVSLFLITNDDIFAVLRSSLVARYPGMEFIKEQDPFAKFGNTWDDAKVGYSDFNAVELGYGANKVDTQKISQDLLPSLSWRQIQIGNNEQTNNPINQLIKTLEEVKDGEYAVFQIILKPAHQDKESMKKEYKTLYKTLSTNSNYTSISQVTEDEKNVLNAIASKINSECYSFKFRFAFFKKNKKVSSNINWELIPMGFLKQFNTPFQSFKILTPYDYSKFGLEFLNQVEPRKNSGLFQASYTTKESEKETVYKKILTSDHGVESIYRKKQNYINIVTRNIDNGSPAQLIDIDSLTCIFHFPSTKSANVMTAAKLNPIKTDNSWDTMPSNLPF